MAQTADELSLSKIEEVFKKEGINGMIRYLKERPSSVMVPNDPFSTCIPTRIMRLLGDISFYSETLTFCFGILDIAKLFDAGEVYGTFNRVFNRASNKVYDQKLDALFQLWQTQRIAICTELMQAEMKASSS